MAFGSEGEIDEGLSAPYPPRKGREKPSQLLRSGREMLRSLTGQLDETVGDSVRGQRRVHLWPRRLHLHEAKMRQFLHGPVDLRGRNAALATNGRRVGNAEN